MPAIVAETLVVAVVDLLNPAKKAAKLTDTSQVGVHHLPSARIDARQDGSEVNPVPAAGRIMRYIERYDDVSQPYDVTVGGDVAVRAVRRAPCVDLRR